MRGKKRKKILGLEEFQGNVQFPSLPRKLTVIGALNYCSDTNDLLRL